MSHGLNPEQQEAVQTLSGPMLVLAGAGSGKTRVVTFRIANLIRHGTPPDRILAVTFTNKAAKEMRERISKMIGPKRRPPRGAATPPAPVIGTFHSNCVQILRRHARKLGYPERFAIYDRSDQESPGQLSSGDIVGWQHPHPAPPISRPVANVRLAFPASSVEIRQIPVAELDDVRAHERIVATALPGESSDPARARGPDRIGRCVR